MKIVKTFIKVVLFIILILLLSYNAYKFFCIHILKKNMVTINGYTVLEVVSGSMEPTLHIGDLIVIDTKVDDYKKNDIVTFYDRDGTFTTHRIISINNKKMITKGDNNNVQDAPTSTEQLLGRYVFKINKGQKLLSVFKNPIVIILILTNGILFSIFISIDKNGDVILDEQEKEYMEFKEYLTKEKKDK